MILTTMEKVLHVGAKRGPDYTMTPPAKNLYIRRQRASEGWNDYLATDPYLVIYNGRM